MTQPVNEITSQDVQKDPQTGTYQFSDEAMLKLIVDDAEAGDSWMNQNAQWAAGWTESDRLYQSPRSAFDGLANISVPKFTLSNTLSAIIPKVMQGLFYDDPPFVLRPRPGTKPDITRAKSALFAAQTEDMKFEEEIEVGLESMGLLGTGIWKWGWLSKKKKIKTYKRKDNATTVDLPLSTAQVHTPDSDKHEIVYEEIDIERPWIKSCDLATVLVDGGCRRGDITKAKQVIYRDYATWKDLENLRDVEGYDIPDEETLKSFFLEKKTAAPGDNMAMTMPEGMRGWLQHALPRNYKTTADPLEYGLEILERWDADKVGVMLSYENQNILIRNEPNPYGEIPFKSANWRNIRDCFYGQGLGQLIGSEQMVEQGTVALALGMLAYGLQPVAVMQQGFNSQSQPLIWDTGGIIKVDGNVNDYFKFAEFPKVPPEAWQMVGLSQATAAETAGANQQVTMGAGAQGVKTTGMRSGTGAALVGQANASRLDGPVERFIRQVFIPWIYKMDELNNDKLPTKVLNQVLGNELGSAFKVDHIEFRNAKFEFEVLAGAHLGAKKEMQQFMVFVINLMNNPTFVENVNESGYNFNGVKIFQTMADLAATKYTQDFLIPMTPQQKQLRAANSPAGVAQQKNRGAQQLGVQKFQQEQRLLEQEQLGKAAGEATRTLLEHALQQEEAPGNETIGDTTI